MDGRIVRRLALFVVTLTGANFISLDEILRNEVIWQRRTVVRFGLAVMGGPNFQTSAAKRRLSKLANDNGTAENPHHGHLRFDFWPNGCE